MYEQAYETKMLKLQFDNHLNASYWQAIINDMKIVKAETYHQGKMKI